MGRRTQADMWSLREGYCFMPADTGGHLADTGFKPNYSSFCFVAEQHKLHGGVKTAGRFECCSRADMPLSPVRVKTTACLQQYRFLRFLT